MDKPNILVVNDDGIEAPGIKSLIEVAQEFGNIYVMAPNKPQSGQGHAITIHHPIWVKKVDHYPGIEAYECSGTPVDCVKIARHVYFEKITFDLCVSGINHGSNAAINIVYSGTMSAAMEASITGIPSIGFSLMNVAYDANFEGSKHYARKIIDFALSHKFEHSKLLNVNIPDLPISEIKGMRICKQGKSGWAEEFVEAKDPRGKPYYWMAGHFVLNEEDHDSDIHALGNDYVSIVPSMHDLTSHPAINELQQLNSDE